MFNSRVVQQNDCSIVGFFNSRFVPRGRMEGRKETNKTKLTVEKVKVSLKPYSTMSDLHRGTFVITSRWILLITKNVSDNSFRENQTHALCSVTLCSVTLCSVTLCSVTLCSVTFSWQSYQYWDNVETYGRDGHAASGNIIPRMRVACRINRATAHTQNM